MFQKKGSPEKNNGIKVQSFCKEENYQDLKCHKCGKVIGSQKGAITIIAGKTTVSISNNDIVCKDCKGE